MANVAMTLISFLSFVYNLIFVQENTEFLRILGQALNQYLNNFTTYNSPSPSKTKQNDQKAKTRKLNPKFFRVKGDSDG